MVKCIRFHWKIYIFIFKYFMSKNWNLTCSLALKIEIISDILNLVFVFHHWTYMLVLLYMLGVNRLIQKYFCYCFCFKSKVRTGTLWSILASCKIAFDLRFMEEKWQDWQNSLDTLIYYITARILIHFCKRSQQ